MASAVSPALSNLICPVCRTEHRPTALKCGCGHQFRPVQETPLWSVDLDVASMSGFFGFGRFIAPPLIKILYVVGVVGIAVASGLLAYQSSVSTKLLAEGLLSPRAQAMVLAVIVFIVANVAWRVVCELLMIPFRIYALLLIMPRRKKRGGL